MTEIEKMYENANIKQDRMCEWTCKDSETCNLNCEHYGSMQLYYPPFTAEKQFKIIKLLPKIRGDIQLCYIANQYIFVVNFGTSECQWANKYHDKLDEALADMVNVLWQSLPGKDKEEIRNILNA